MSWPQEPRPSLCPSGAELAQVPLWRELEVGPSLLQQAPLTSYPLGYHRQVKAPFRARMPCGSREESAGFPEGSPGSGKRAERSGGVTPTAAWIWGSAPTSQALSSTPSQSRTRRRALLGQPCRASPFPPAGGFPFLPGPAPWSHTGRQAQAADGEGRGRGWGARCCFSHLDPE